MRRVALHSLILCILINLQTTLPANAEQDIDTNGIFSVFSVGQNGSSDQFVGTAFYIGNNIAVTAAHVLYDEGLSRLSTLPDDFLFVAGTSTNQSEKFSPSGRYECPLSARDTSKRRDICFIELNGVSLQNYPSYHTSCPEFDTLPKLRTAGFYRSNGTVQESLPVELQVQAIILGTTFVEDLSTEITNGYIQTQYEPQGGSSGSPIFDAAGNVVGVHAGEVDTQWFSPFSGLDTLTLGNAGQVVFDQTECIGAADDAVFEDTQPSSEGWANPTQGIQGGAEWVIDLYVTVVEYTEQTVEVSILEVKTNYSNIPITVLNRDRDDEIFGEPMFASVEVKTWSQEEVPENFGLIDYSSFGKLDIDAKSLLIKNFYQKTASSSGKLWAQYAYDARGSTTTERDNRMEASRARSENGGYWTFNYRYDDLDVPLDPGDSQITLSKYIYKIDPDNYYSPFEEDFWGTTPRFPLRNSIYIIDTSNVEAEIRADSFKSFTKSSSGKVDETAFEEIENVGVGGAVIYHKNLPRATGIRIKFNWAQ